MSRHQSSSWVVHAPHLPILYFPLMCTVIHHFLSIWSSHSLGYYAFGACYYGLASKKKVGSFVFGDDNSAGTHIMNNTVLYAWVMFLSFLTHFYMSVIFALKRVTDVWIRNCDKNM